MSGRTGHKATGEIIISHGYFSVISNNTNNCAHTQSRITWGVGIPCHFLVVFANDSCFVSVIKGL